MDIDNLGEQFEWEKKITCKSEHGSISVEKSKSISARIPKGYQIEFTTSIGKEVNFGSRRATAFILKQLLENFGEYIGIKQFDNPELTYSGYNSIKLILQPLKQLLKDTEYVIQKNPDLHNQQIQYKIIYKPTNLESQGQEQVEES